MKNFAEMLPECILSIYLQRTAVKIMVLIQVLAQFSEKVPSTHILRLSENLHEFLIENPVYKI
ncbi:MAG: hypothetical protein IJZ76_09580, partial [Lachnospiraceae bacterium]|nr:hypothetical protein [Lachnospiraceae bacterium]